VQNKMQTALQDTSATLQHITSSRCKEQCRWTA